MVADEHVSALVAGPSAQAMHFFGVSAFNQKPLWHVSEMVSAVASELATPAVQVCVPAEQAMHLLGVALLRMLPTVVAVPATQVVSTVADEHVSALPPPAQAAHFPAATKKPLWHVSETV